MRSDTKEMTATYQQGIDARRNAVPLEANPYHPDDPKHQTWESGWRGENRARINHPEYEERR